MDLSSSRLARSAISLFWKALLACTASIAALSVTIGPIVVDFAIEIICREGRSPRLCAWALLAIGWVLGSWFLVAWPAKPTSRSSFSRRFDVGFRNPTAVEVLVLHAIAIVLYSLMLDCGEHMRACLYAEIGYGAGATLVVARRARSLTWGDLLYLRWGGQAIIAITVPVAIQVWRVREVI